MKDIFSYSGDRRLFIKWGMSVILPSLFTMPSVASSAPSPCMHQRLSFYNIHTNETLSVCYRKDGNLVNCALNRINHIMRDFRTGEIKPVDPRLLDLLHRIVQKIKPDSPISIISGYRSPQTNAALRKKTGGVAKKSLHMQGRAIDIRIPGCSTRTIRQLAIDCKSGGVGYYSKSDFVHLDTGRVRTW